MARAANLRFFAVVFSRVRAGALRSLAVEDSVLARRLAIANLGKDKLAVVNEVRQRRGLSPLAPTSGP